MVLVPDLAREAVSVVFQSSHSGPTKVKKPPDFSLEIRVFCLDYNVAQQVPRLFQRLVMHLTVIFDRNSC